MDVAKANELFETAARLSADAGSLRDALQVEFLSSQLAEVVASDYDLGEVVGVEQIFGGYTNLSFAVVVAAPEGEHKYFVRKYNRAITEREVRFEHALVNHISGKGFHIAAQVFPTKGAAPSSRARRRSPASASPGCSPSTRCSRAKTSTPGSATA